MKVYRSLNEFNKVPGAVVTSGMFDGVHKGHQKILSRLSETATQNNGESVVITFWPHPKKIIHPHQSDIKVLTTLEEKISMLEKNKINHLLIIPFTHEFSQLSSEQFVKEILVKCIGTKKLVIGYDHKFGKNREGSFEYLSTHASEFGFEVEEIPRQDIENVGVSSTLIRQSLLTGKVNEASIYLGREYSITGTVVKGKQLGHTLGFPTANIAVNDPNKLIPKDGIYAVRIRHGQTLYNGMLSIGFNPTVHGTERTIEVNIFNFDQMIYGEQLEIFFIQFLREEENFNNLEALVDQLKKDKEESLRILS